MKRARCRQLSIGCAADNCVHGVIQASSQPLRRGKRPTNHGLSYQTDWVLPCFNWQASDRAVIPPNVRSRLRASVGLWRAFDPSGPDLPSAHGAFAGHVGRVRIRRGLRDGSVRSRSIGTGA